MSYVVTEGVESTWHYHWSKDGVTSRALCGAMTMPTGARPEDWGWPGHPGHIRYKYCKRCADLKAEAEVCHD